MQRYAFLSLTFFSETVKAAEEKGGMPQLNPESFTSQIFWLSIFFVLLFILVHFVFLPKIKNIRDKRDDTIENYLLEARKINDSINVIVEKMRKDLDQAKNEQNTRIKKTFDENKKILDDELLKINEEFEIKKNKLIDSIDLNRESVLNNLPSICVKLSDELYEKIMKKKIKGNTAEFNKMLGDK